MKNLFKTLENYFSFFLLFIAFSLAVSTIFSKGDPAIFFSPIWITVFFICEFYFIFISIIKLSTRKFLQGATLLSITTLAIFFHLNAISFEHKYIPVKRFNSSKSKLLENDRIMLLEHGFGDTEKLKNYEKAVFLSNSKEVTVELNKPLKLSKNRKILLTGNGQNFLITRSAFLLEMLIAAATSVLLAIIMVGREWKK